MRKLVDVSRLRTEQSNPASVELDTKSALEIATIINAGDARVPAAVKQALPQIARAADMIAKAFLSGGRLIYVGTGTSGRLGALDAAECPPTFSTDPKMVQYVIAGGDRALGQAVEADEDNTDLGRRDLAKRKPGIHDVVVGLAASGRTPYTIAALDYARSRGARTVCITCNPDSPIERVSDIRIVVDVGPEVIAGSTRMKAGTAEKLVCNTLTTCALARIGYVYGNLMVNVKVTNSKLRARAVAIIRKITSLDRDEAETLLKKSGDSVPVALVMAIAGVSRPEAELRLQRSNGRVRVALKRPLQ
jgi:N-acetylmuramic acid 6-phosphate etherase